MNLNEAQQALNEICFAQNFPVEVASELYATEERLKLYRQMVRHRIEDMLSASLPRTKAQLGKKVWSHWYDRFLAESPPESRFIRHVTEEYTAFCKPLWLEGGEDPVAIDLLTYESTRWLLGDVYVESPQYTDFSLDKPVVLNPALRLIVVQHPVHRTAGDGDKGEQSKVGAAKGEGFHLCMYRVGNQSQIQIWVLSDLIASIVRAWQASSGAAATVVQQALASKGRELTPQFLDSLCTVLADFLDRGIILGSSEEA